MDEKDVGIYYPFDRRVLHWSEVGILARTELSVTAL